MAFTRPRNKKEMQERENKNRYCNALSQIDRFGDFDPLLINYGRRAC